MIHEYLCTTPALSPPCRILKLQHAINVKHLQIGPGPFVNLVQLAALEAVHACPSIVNLDEFPDLVLACCLCWLPTGPSTAS